MNIDAKIHNKILANWIQPHSERMIHHERFIPSSQGWFNVHKSFIVIYHNKGKDKTIWSSSTDAEKALTKINIHSWQKALNQCAYGGNISQHNNSCLWQNHNQHNCFEEKLKAFPLKSGTKTRMPTLTTSLQHSIEQPQQPDKKKN